MSDFLLGGISATTAICFCNPFDVAKTRLQLQGELGGKSGSQRGIYRGVFHCMWTIVKHEGIVGLQRGLVPGAAFQFTLTSTRFGFYG
jgi:solute carrier family 25 protein 34/35